MKRERGGLETDRGSRRSQSRKLKSGPRKKLNVREEGSSFLPGCEGIANDQGRSQSCKDPCSKRRKERQVGKDYDDIARGQSSAMSPAAAMAWGRRFLNVSPEGTILVSGWQASLPKKKIRRCKVTGGSSVGGEKKVGKKTGCLRMQRRRRGAVALRARTATLDRGGLRQGLWGKSDANVWRGLKHSRQKEMRSTIYKGLPCHPSGEKKPGATHRAYTDVTGILSMPRP